MSASGGKACRCMPGTSAFDPNQTKRPLYKTLPSAQNRTASSVLELHSMLRRKFIGIIGGTAIAWPLTAMAQQPSNKVWRIAHVYPGRYDNPADIALYDVFRAELGTLGYIEGKNLVIDQRSADGKIERLPSLVSELIALRPDVIVAITTPAIAAAQRATSTIPIIMAPATELARASSKASLGPGETSRAWPTWLATRSAKALSLCTRSCRRQNVSLCVCLTIQLIRSSMSWPKLPQKLWDLQLFA
jgi:hypothetical protein